MVKRVEAFREQDGAAAHYFASSPDGSVPGTYYVHLSDMSANPVTELEAVAYHEGLPGHHMQIAIARELESVPRFAVRPVLALTQRAGACIPNYWQRKWGVIRIPIPTLVDWSAKCGVRFVSW